MLFYVENSKTKRAYADQELAALAAELAAQALTKWDDVQKRPVADDLSVPTYAAVWDGVAPFVTTLAGAFPVNGIRVMGWPQTDTPP